MCPAGSWTPIIRNRQTEVFCNFLGVTFLKLMYFIQYLNTFVKRFSCFFFIFNLSFYLPTFPPEKLLRFQSKFRGRKRCFEPKNIKLNPKTLNDFSKTFRVPGNFCKNFYKKETNFVVGFFHARCLNFPYFNLKNWLHACMHFACFACMSY